MLAGGTSGKRWAHGPCEGSSNQKVRLPNPVVVMMALRPGFIISSPTATISGSVRLCPLSHGAAKIKCVEAQSRKHLIPQESLGAKAGGPADSPVHKLEFRPLPGLGPSCPSQVHGRHCRLVTALLFREPVLSLRVHPWPAADGSWQVTWHLSATSAG